MNSNKKKSAIGKYQDLIRSDIGKATETMAEDGYSEGDINEVVSSVLSDIQTVSESEMKLHDRFIIKREPKGVVSLGFGTFDLANLSQKDCERLVRKKVSWITDSQADKK